MTPDAPPAETPHVRTRRISLNALRVEIDRQPLSPVLEIGSSAPAVILENAVVNQPEVANKQQSSVTSVAPGIEIVGCGIVRQTATLAPGSLNGLDSIFSSKTMRRSSTTPRHQVKEETDAGPFPLVPEPIPSSTSYSFESNTGVNLKRRNSTIAPSIAPSIALSRYQYVADPSDNSFIRRLKSFFQFIFGKERSEDSPKYSIKLMSQTEIRAHSSLSFPSLELCDPENHQNQQHVSGKEEMLVKSLRHDQRTSVPQVERDDDSIISNTMPSHSFGTRPSLSEKRTSKRIPPQGSIDDTSFLNSPNASISKAGPVVKHSTTKVNNVGLGKEGKLKMVNLRSSHQKLVNELEEVKYAKLVSRLPRVESYDEQLPIGETW